MKLKIYLSTIFLLLSLAIHSQNDEKIALPFRYLRDQKQQNSKSTTASTLFNKFVSGQTTFKNGQLETTYSCIIYTTQPEVLKASNVTTLSVKSKFCVARLTLSQIEMVAALPEVSFVDTSKKFTVNNDISNASSGASLLHAGRLDGIAYKGDGVIVAIIDTGIDWDHYDFRNPDDPTKSRILRIWDQTITAIAGESPPAGNNYNFGVEYTKVQIEDELDGSPAGYVREKDNHGHGTHVAGIAAGNGSAYNGMYTGIAPNADIVVIKAGDGSFDTANIITGLDYLKDLSKTFGKPIVVNMSLGSSSGAHDGTDPFELAVDDFSNSDLGRVVVISAGNENGKSIHKQLTINSGQTGTVTFTVPSTSSTKSTSVFDFLSYVNDASIVTATVTAPDGTKASATSSNGTPVMGGAATVFMTNQVDSESGDTMVQVYVTRSTTSSNASGTWTLSITNPNSSAKTVDGWLDLKGDDYSTTTMAGSDNNSLITIPGCSNTAITVGSYMAKLDWADASGGIWNYGNYTQDGISSFSSIGPRRDNVIKPDITAHGQAAISCLSSDSGLASNSQYMIVNNANGSYRLLQGTSMASPVVAGCVALLLQKNPHASYTDIKTVLKSNATKDSYTGSTENSTWGSGKIDVFKAASSSSYCQALNRKTYNYETPYTGSQNNSQNLSYARAASKFTTTSSGLIAGVYFKTGQTLSLSKLTVELRTSNSSGKPDTLLGSIDVNKNLISTYSWNYIDLSSLNVTLSNATDYFIVLVPGSSSDIFSLGYESTSGRSYTSYNGSTWTSYTNNFRIRPATYDSAPASNAKLTLSSATGTDHQNLCSNVAITPITYTFDSTATNNIACSGLPSGLTCGTSPGLLTISGTPTQSGQFIYTVKNTLTCDTATVTGSLTVAATPTISSVTVAGSTTITINGAYFSGTSNPVVTIGGQSMTITTVTDSKIVTKVPTNFYGGKVVVTNACNLSSSAFAYPYSAPTDISLSSLLIIEGNSVGDTIGKLSATDPDPIDSTFFSLVSGDGSTDNANFSISGSILKAAVVFEKAKKSSYSIRIRVTDEGGLWYEKIFVITIKGDSDKDGIIDEIDICPNTVAGVTVDYNGCEVFVMPSNNYSVQAIATTCVGQQNGAISVSAVNKSYIYVVTINGKTGFQLDGLNSFKSQFTNLAAGTYTICITILNKTNYEQCYSIKITEPSTLAVTSKISSSGKEVNYTLNGASEYLLTFNGNTQIITDNQVTLKLASGQNTISIATDLYCQGQFDDIIFLGDKLVSYPNPVQDVLNVALTGTNSYIEAIITDLSGKIIVTKPIKIAQSKIVQFDLSELGTGIYLAHLKGESIDETIKFIKK